MMDKNSLSERDICTKYITPALVQSGWDLHRQIHEEVTFAMGWIRVRGYHVRRDKPKRADYVLYYNPNIPISVIEAKDNNHHLGDGMQQAIDYGEPYQTLLDPPPGPPADEHGNFLPFPEWKPSQPKPPNWPPHIHPPKEVAEYNAE